MNVYPIIEAPERRRFFDWRFLTALTALVLVGFLVWAGFRNYELREAETAQKDALISQLADRSQQIQTLEGQVAGLNGRIAVLQDRARSDRKTAAEERRRAARERAKLIRQQERMIELLRQVDITYTPASSSYVSPATTSRIPTAVTSSSARVLGASASMPERAPTAGKSGKTPPGNAHGLSH